MNDSSALVPSQRGGLSVFDYTDGRQIRTFLDEASDPWFVASDVCAVLEIANVGNALTRLDGADIRSTDARNARGEMRPTRIVNESGLYDLILDSRKTEAKAFRRWVTSQVLPSIRKTGAYVDPRATEEQLGAVADLAHKRLQLLQSAVGLVDPMWLEAKTRHQIARGLGEAPEIDPTTRPLTVGEYLEDKGVTGTAQRAMSPKFGKRLKKRFKDERGREPLPTERFVDGALRSVAGYTEADRHLFDLVWGEITDPAA